MLEKCTPPAKWGAAEAFGIIIRVLCQNDKSPQIKRLEDYSQHFTDEMFENSVDIISYAGRKQRKLMSNEGIKRQN